MIEEITLTKRVQTPTSPNEWCYQNQGENFRYFTKRVLLGKDAEPWHECTNNYKEGYDMLWQLRQEEHTAEDRQSLEAQYAAWQSSNPALAEEIDHAVPTGLEPEQTPEQEQEGGEG